MWSQGCGSKVWSQGRSAPRVQLMEQSKGKYPRGARELQDAYTELRRRDVGHVDWKSYGRPSVPILVRREVDGEV